MVDIRYTFYTAADDFAYRQSVNDSIAWLKSRGYVQAVVQAPDGTVSPGEKVDDLDDESISRWVASVSMGIVRKKADDGGYIGFRTTSKREWISIFASRIEAIGAQVIVEDDDLDEGAAIAVDVWTDLEPTFGPPN
jgi:hypothetical protein